MSPTTKRTHQVNTFQDTRAVDYFLKSARLEHVNTTNIEPESQPEEREIGPFVVKPLSTEKWLGDAFYREHIGGSGQPQGTIPQD